MDGLVNPQTKPTVAVPDWLPRRRLHVREYHRMVETEIVPECDARGNRDRIELIEGELIAMAPMGVPHAAAVMALIRVLAPLMGDAAVLSVQSPLRLSDFTEPLPDVLVLRPPRQRYRLAQASAADAFLVMEVADTTLRYDLEYKAPLYARNGVAEYWVFDLNADKVVVHRTPRDGAYAEVGRVARDATLELPGLPGLRLAVADVIG